MNNNYNYDHLLQFCYFVSLGVLVIAITLLEKNYYILLITWTFAVINLLLLIAYKILIRKNIVENYKAIDNYIDDIIKGTVSDNALPNDDTLLSKLLYKLNRLYMHLIECNESSIQEKKKIQSLISDISHQLKTPLTNLNLYNSMIIDQIKADETGREFAVSMDRQINKLNFLMDALIKMSRLETDLISLNITDKPIYNTLASALAQVMCKAEKKHIDFKVNCNEDIIVSHDVKWTCEAIFNVLDNAVKYSPVNSSVIINVIKYTIYTRVDIHDSGIGIPKENFNRIFDRFYRGEEVSEIEGVGLGLFLTREILSMEYGYIKVASDKSGTTFSIFLLLS